MNRDASKVIKVTKDEFRKTLQKNLKKSSRYIPKKVEDKIKEIGMGRYFGKNASRAATRRQTLRAFKQLKKEGVIKEKYSPEYHYGKIVRQRLNAQNEAKESTKRIDRKSDKSFSPFSWFRKGKDTPQVQLDEQKQAKKVNLGVRYLPEEGIDSKNFVRYMGNLLSERALNHMTGVMREWGLLGGRKNLTTNEMKRVLFMMRDEGYITMDKIGKEIALQERRRKVFVSEGIESDIEEEERRYSAKERENLPEGIRRSVIRRAASSVSRIGEDEKTKPEPPTTSISRTKVGGGQKDSNDENQNVPAVSISRRKKSKTKDPSDKPESLPDILSDF